MNLEIKNLNEKIERIKSNVLKADWITLNKYIMELSNIEKEINSLINEIDYDFIFNEAIKNEQCYIKIIGVEIPVFRQNRDTLEFIKGLLPTIKEKWINDKDNRTPNHNILSKMKHDVYELKSRVKNILIEKNKTFNENIIDVKITYEPENQYTFDCVIQNLSKEINKLKNRVKYLEDAMEPIE